jgi:Fe-S cluster assembly protein SufD
MKVMAPEQNIYSSQFGEIVRHLPGRGLTWLDHLRETGIQQFAGAGFPTTRMEEWKYTNIAPISRVAFRPARRTTLPDAVREQVDAFPQPRLVFVNGFLASPEGARSQTAPTKEKLVITGLSKALANPRVAATLEPHLGHLAETGNHPFVAWNTAFFADGACVVIPPGTVVQDPIHLVFVSAATDSPSVAFPRNLIVVGERSQVSVVEIYLSVSGGTFLTNAVTEIAIARGASVDYHKFEHEFPETFHVATVKATLGRDASLTSHAFSLGAALSRNELRVALKGEGAQCTLAGLYLADEHRLVDNHTEIDHCQPHATSRELYKGVLAGYGEGVFNGAIIVRKDAQKTDAVQHNKNLLLSEHAQINTKPQLEIHADDVRCAHGASIGQISEDALFYLRTRGVDERTARHILIRGFAAEILDGIRVPSVRRLMDLRLQEWFERRLEAA